MRTLLIHQAFAAPNDPGGTRHYELARHCIKHGDQFMIVTSDTHYLSGRRVTPSPKLITEQAEDGVRIMRVYTYPSLHRSFTWRVVSFLSFMVTSVWGGLRAGPVDIVMGTSPPIFQLLSAWVVASIRRRPLLLEIRDLWPEFAVDMGVLTNPILIRLARALERFLYGRATHLLVNSPAYHDYLLAKGIPAAKITLISNGVDMDMFDPEATGEALRQTWNLDGQFVVTYAGALGLANDIATILRAADHLRDYEHIRFLLVGDGKERAHLEALAQDLRLSNVTFIGSRPKTEMPMILAASDVCLATLQNIPMFRTTYPNKVFDYMAAGRPTVLAIDGVIREVIEAAKGGIFAPPGDSRALADAVLALYQDQERAKAMGRAARDYVGRHFNRLQQAQAFYELLHALAQRR